MNIIFLDGYTLQTSDSVLDPIKALGQFRVFDRTDSYQVVERGKDADVIIVNKTSITAEHIAQMPKLRLICVAATGYDKIDIKAARERGIPVCNCADYSTQAVAQMALSLLLEAANDVGFYTGRNRHGEWSSCEDFCYTTHSRLDLEGKHAAIVGFGHIGRALASFLHPMGVKIYAVTSKSASQLPKYVTPISLEDAFTTCDIVSLNCPLTEKNRGFVNASLLAKTKTGLYLVNTARGALVNEQDVAQALQTGKLAAYCTDVLAQEPPSPYCPLLKAPNAYITPHIGWKTPLTVERIVDIVTRNIQAFSEGNPQSVVN